MNAARPTPRINRALYYKMAEEELFTQRVELIDGVITARPKPTPLEAVSLTLAHEWLVECFPDAVTRNQAPLQFNSFTELEPDLALVAGPLRRWSYIDIDHPATAILVIEVSELTLEIDRTTKAHIYASANIPDFWIINVEDACIEIRRQPIYDPASPFGHRYQSIEIVKPPDSISPLANPTAQIPIADLLP